MGVEWSGFFPVLVACLGAGLAFTGIVYATMRIAANALSTANQPTEIALGNFKVTTQSAFVALFIVSCISMIVIPLYWLYTSNSRDRDDAPITFIAHLKPAASTVQIIPQDYGTSQISQVRIYRSSNPQNFSISPQEYERVDVEAHYNWSNKDLVVTINNKTYQVPIQGISATLPDPIPLRPLKTPAPTVAHDVTLTQPQAVTSRERTFPDPPAQRFKP
jgi:hypothetical protein